MHGKRSPRGPAQGGLMTTHILEGKLKVLSFLTFMFFSSEMKNGSML